MPDASASRCLAELARADVGHLACHGSFRADNPLFSTLTLADGPLTVYDLARCRPLPKTLVLSACNAAVGATLRGGALLGLASALMSFGASSVVAPLTPVSDLAVVPVMDRLHRRLVAGTDAAAALATARTGGEDARSDGGSVRRHRCVSTPQPHRDPRRRRLIPNFFRDVGIRSPVRGLP